MKSKTTALVLSIFLGELGVDRFYLGQIGLGIWWIIDIILIATGKITDKDGNPLQ